MSILVIIILLAVVMMFVNNYNQQEGYSMGAMIQLYTKGPILKGFLVTVLPMDTYLSGSVWKYIPPYYYSPYFDYNYGWIPFDSYDTTTRTSNMNYNYYGPYGSNGIQL
jgi:hypothetical protein